MNGGEVQGRFFMLLCIFIYRFFYAHIVLSFRGLTVSNFETLCLRGVLLFQ